MQNDTKFVLSLGGGGIRMFAHASLLRILEKLGVQNRISEIWGASGGAFIGFYYSIGMTPDEMVNEAMEMMRKRHLNLTPSVFSIAKKIVLDTLWSYNNQQNLKGFHDLQDSLQKMVKSYPNNNGHYRFPLYTLAYNLKKNQTDVLTPDSVPEGVYPDFIFQADPIDALVASSSVPILFKPKIIDDQNGRRTYADGATGEEVPTVSIYKKWIRDKELGIEKNKRLLVMSVDLHPDLASIGFLNNWMLKKIPAFQYILMTINLTDLMRRARVAEQKRILINDPNVELWELDFDLKGGGLMNVDLIPKIIQKAEHTFPRQLDKINDSLLG